MTQGSRFVELNQKLSPMQFDAKIVPQMVKGQFTGPCKKKDKEFPFFSAFPLESNDSNQWLKKYIVLIHM